MNQSEKNKLDTTNPMEFAKSISKEENLPLVKNMLEIGLMREIEQINLFENEGNVEMEHDNNFVKFVVKFAKERENRILRFRMAPKTGESMEFQIEIK